MKKLLIIVILLTCTVFSQPVVNGDLSDAQYVTIATKQNSNSSFGSAIDVSRIVYYADHTNSNLYLGVVGKLPTNNGDGIGIWLNISGTSSPTGRSAGQNLGIQSAGGHYIGGGNNASNVQFKSGFEVDYMFALNSGSTNNSVFIDAAKHVTTSVIEYQGATDQSGTLSVNSSASGSVFTGSSIAFAFNNGGGANQGFEARIPFAQLGATSAMSIQVFAFVVSNSAFFSDVTVPGNRSGGNLGFSPNFNTEGGGPYYSDPAAPLPVELSSFSAALSGKSVVLNWRTETEVNNYGFDVERSSDKNSWSTVGFVHGNGNSNSPKQYSFADNSVSGAGKYYYRLKQMDNDGTTEYSKVLEIAFDQPMEYALGQNYPNPFNPTTAITFSVPEAGFVNLSVFDLLGQKVAELVNGTINAGTYTMDFDATNLKSGIYFYTMKAGSFTETRKMMLTK